MPKLIEYQDIINDKPIHIATVTPFGATEPKGVIVVEAVEIKEFV